MNKYFVYVFLDPNKTGNYEYDDYKFNYEPFYVGKGSGRRIKKHFNYVNDLNDNTYKYRKIRNILSIGEKPIILKILENVSEKEAFEIESKLIQVIGRYDQGKGPLTNHTDGGEGVSGKIVSDETKKKISESLKNCGRVYKPHTEEFKEYMKNKISGRISPMKNKHQSEEAKEKISKNHSKHRCKKIIQLDKEGIFIKEWNSAVEASKTLNINNSRISYCCKDNTKSAGGYLWKFKK